MDWDGTIVAEYKDGQKIDGESLDNDVLFHNSTDILVEPAPAEGGRKWARK